MSFLELEYSFKRNDCVMVYGINKTDSGADSNGAGKSTILEAITLAISGETNRNISRDEFITDGEEETYIEFLLTNKTCAVNQLVIKRWFYRKKSSKIELWENGELNNEMTSVLESSKRIFELLGLTKEDLYHFFIIGQETNYSFLSASDTEQKAVIGRFGGTDFINEKIEQQKASKKLKKVEYDDLNSIIDSNEGKLEAVEESIADEKANAKSRVANQVKFYNEEKSKKEASIKSKKASIVEKDKELKKLEKERKDSKFKDVDKIVKYKGFLKKKKELKRENQKSINEAESTKHQLELLSEGEIECPNCEHHFILDSEIKLEEVPAFLEAVEEELKDLGDLKESIGKKISEYEEWIEKAEALEDELEELDDDIESKSKEITKLEKEIKALEEGILTDEASITKVKKKSKEESPIAKLEEKKADLDEVIKSDKELLSKLSDEIDDFDFWIEHLGKKGFQTFLTNKSIKSIEGITNSYLKKINTDLQLSIEGFSVLKSGDLREKIDVSIIRNGVKLGTFNRYSGGEKGRINLANILAMQSLFNMNAPNGGLNFLGLDEVFEGLDTTGQRELISILENMRVTTLVVSHRNETIGADNEIFIEKVDGVSSIV